MLEFFNPGLETFVLCTLLIEFDFEMIETILLLFEAGFKRDDSVTKHLEFVC